MKKIWFDSEGFGHIKFGISGDAFHMRTLFFIPLNNTDKTIQFSLIKQILLLFLLDYAKLMEKREHF